MTRMVPAEISLSRKRRVMDCVLPVALVNKKSVPCGLAHDNWVRIQVSLTSNSTHVPKARENPGLT